MTERKVAVIAGAGPGNGFAMARRFAAGGYATALLARNGDDAKKLAAELPDAAGYACDVTEAASVEACFTAIANHQGTPDILLFNAGSGAFKDFEDVTVDDFEMSWRVNAYGAFLCSQAVLAGMKAKGAGAIIFTGATASLRGGKRTAAFASAKAAQRSLAESMARTLWPQGIHISLIIVDGVVDLPRTRANMPDKDQSFFVEPEGIAETAWFLAHQNRQAWSFEVEARPFGENW